MAFNFAVMYIFGVVILIVSFLLARVYKSAKAKYTAIYGSGSKGQIANDTGNRGTYLACSAAGHTRYVPE